MSNRIIYFNFGNDEFEYEIGNKEWEMQALKFIAISSKVSLEDVKKIAKHHFFDLDMLEEDGEFQDRLQEIYYEDAYDEYQEMISFHKDPYGYYGLSKSDFF